MEIKKWLIIGLLFLVLIAVFSVGYWLYQNNIPWKTYSFNLNNQKNIAIIKYPSKYQNVSDNVALPDQKIGLFCLINVINFQLSNETRDKNIASYVASLAELDPQSGSQPVENDKETIDANYKKAKYGFNTVYFINEYNQSPDFVVGDIFDGEGHRLNFTYHTKDVEAKEIKALISKIKF